MTKYVQSLLLQNCRIRERVNFVLIITFVQVAIQPLRDGTDLRDNVQVALADFKETCGQSPISNIKQCIRNLATRVQSSTEQASLRLYMKGDVSFY